MCIIYVYTYLYITTYFNIILPVAVAVALHSLLIKDKFFSLHFLVATLCFDCELLRHLHICEPCEFYGHGSSGLLLTLY